MQHYRPFEKFWYVQRSIDNNPLRNGLNPDRSNGLESIVDVTSPNKDNGEHKSLLGYVGSTLANGLGYAGSVIDNIFSVVPSSVKKFALAGSLAGLLYVAMACSSPASTPTPWPTPTPTPIAAPPTPPPYINSLLSEPLNLKDLNLEEGKVTLEKIRMLESLYATVGAAARTTSDPSAEKYYDDLRSYLYQEIAYLHKEIDRVYLLPRMEKPGAVLRDTSGVLLSDTYDRMNTWIETCIEVIRVYGIRWSDCGEYVSGTLSNAMDKTYRSLSKSEKQRQWNRIVEALQYGSLYSVTPLDKAIEALIHYNTPDANESVREVQRMVARDVYGTNTPYNIERWTDVIGVIQITSSLDQPIMGIYNNPTISEDERKTELMRVTSAIKTGARFRGTLADKSIEALIEYATPDADEDIRVIQRNAVKLMFETNDEKSRQNMATIQDTIRKMFDEQPK